MTLWACLQVYGMIAFFSYSQNGEEGFSVKLKAKGVCASGTKRPCPYIRIADVNIISPLSLLMFV